MNVKISSAPFKKRLPPKKYFNKLGNQFSPPLPLAIKSMLINNLHLHQLLSCFDTPFTVENTFEYYHWYSKVYAWSLLRWTTTHKLKGLEGERSTFVNLSICITLLLTFYKFPLLQDNGIKCNHHQRNSALFSSLVGEKNKQTTKNCAFLLLTHLKSGIFLVYDT